MFNQINIKWKKILKLVDFVIKIIRKWNPNECNGDASGREEINEKKSCIIYIYGLIGFWTVDCCLEFDTCNCMQSVSVRINELHLFVCAMVFAKLLSSDSIVVLPRRKIYCIIHGINTSALHLKIQITKYF